MNARGLAVRVAMPAVALAFLLCAPTVRGNDSAAGVSAGGIVLRHEHRIAMRKEVLEIKQFGDEKYQSQFSVSADYDFVNESKEDITTEITFPVPLYRNVDDASENRNLGVFRAWVEGNEIPVVKEVRALAGKRHRDIAPLLRKLGLDIENFAVVRQPDGTRKTQFETLSRDDLERLVRAGALDSVDFKNSAFPATWTVSILWHWKQRFPPGKTVHIRHEYTPSAGKDYGGAALREKDPNALPDACLDSATLKQLDAEAERLKEHGPVSAAYWVNYILTTANKWKTPIREFELRVQARKDYGVSFCWNGKIERISDSTVRAVATNFFPRQELKVYFLGVGQHDGSGSLVMPE
jgi:Domain of unknown function (DUF4424)